MVPGLPRRDQAAPGGDQLKSAFLFPQSTISCFNNRGHRRYGGGFISCYPRGLDPGAMILSGVPAAMCTSRANHHRNIGRHRFRVVTEAEERSPTHPRDSECRRRCIVKAISDRVASRRHERARRDGGTRSGSPGVSQGLPDAGWPVRVAVGQLKTSVNTLPLPRRSSRRVAVTN
jgi:hypothetical protein